jgi:hypothetical protein
MTDEYITKETAILAKEKGFNNGCSYLWGEYEEYEGMHHTDNYNQMNDAKQFSAPTQSLLQRWLRETHKIHIGIDYDNNGWAFFFLTDLSHSNNISWSKDYETYELALEAGLQKALNEIK